MAGVYKEIVESGAETEVIMEGLNGLKTVLAELIDKENWEERVSPEFSGLTTYWNVRQEMTKMKSEKWTSEYIFQCKHPKQAFALEFIDLWKY